MSSHEKNELVKVDVHGLPLVFRPDAGTFTYMGLPAALFWLDPSLLHLLEPLVREIGTDLARALITLHAGRGADADYAYIQSVSPDDFARGFASWSNATAGAGWGRFELSAFDAAGKRATVELSRSWELVMQRGAAAGWGCPFSFGKLVGLFSRAFGENCWAREIPLPEGEDGAPRVEFQIYTSESTMDAALEELRKAQRGAREERLQAEVNSKAEELRRSEMYLRTILRNSPAILFSIDTEGRFMLAEGKQLALLGRAPGQAVGVSAFETYKDTPNVVENLRAALAGEERTYQTNLGKYQFETTATPLRAADGSIMGALGIAIDVTDRHRAEQFERQQRELLERQVEEKQEVIRALGTPVIRLWEGVLLFPLVGALDRARVGQLLETMLAAITAHRAAEVLLDVTGVPSVDAEVADALIGSVQAARLLGAVSSLVGISPNVARAFVQIGADLSAIPTYASLEAGLKHALTRLNYQVTRGPVAK